MILRCLTLFLILNFDSSVGYKGESFPLKYLMPDHQIPESSDVDYYLYALNKVLGRFARQANATDINGALGLFWLKAILKRTIKENENKILESQQQLMKSVILQAEDVTSHYFSHTINALTWRDKQKRAAAILTDEDLQIEAIGEFKRNNFKKWILSNVSFNEHEQAMDELKMSREMYLDETEETFNFGKITKYTIPIRASSYCFSEMIYNPTPWDSKALKPCVFDKYCSDIIYKQAPSFSYSLSHRMLLIMMVHHLRRCYMRSPEEDAALTQALCSSMYRETVYLARRGYFNRDMFMEHIVLCGLLGYEEFFRRHWFRKVVSWVDEEGCVAENFNYEANRTRYLLSKEEKPEERAKILKLSHQVLSAPCHWHPMALTLTMLAHGVRHAVHFSKPIVKDEF